MNRWRGQPAAVSLRYEKLILSVEEPHPQVDVAPPVRPFHALRQSVLMTVRRRAFFYLWKGDEEYEPELHLPQLWNILGL